MKALSTVVARLMTGSLPPARGDHEPPPGSVSDSPRHEAGTRAEVALPPAGSVRGAVLRLSSARVLGILTLMALAGCGGRGEQWDEPLVLEGPIAADGSLVWLDRTLGTLVALDPDSSGSPICLPTPASPRGLGAVGGDVLVIGRERGGAILERIPLSGRATSRIPLRSDFDRIAVAPNGAFAVLFFDPAASPRPGGPAARNLNELAVVDLAAGIATTVELQTGALAPIGVRFEPEGRLAVVLFDRAVALVDLETPSSHVQIPLKLPTGQPLRIRDAILDPSGAFLFVQTAEIDDVIAISIDRGGDRLGASINFIGVGGASELRAIAVPSGPGVDRKVAALYRGRAALLDAGGDTSRTVEVSLNGLPSRISDLGDGLLLLHGEVSRRADSAYVAAWDPATGRIAQDRLEGPIVAPPQVAAGRAYFPHGSIEGRAALSTAAVEREEVRLRLRLRPIGLEGIPVATAIDEATGLLYLGVEVPRAHSGAAPLPGTVDDFDGVTGALVSVSADDLRIDGLTLDATISSLGLIDGYVYALHPAGLGDLTLVPKARLSREDSTRFDGLFATGLMGCER